MIVTEMKRVILKVNKYHKQLWLKLNDTYKLNKQKTEQIYIMIVTETKREILKKKYHKQLWLELNDTYTLNKQKTEQIYIRIVTNIKRNILKENKY